MYIKVHAFPDSREESVREIDKDTVEIHVREPAEMNRANGKMLEIFRKMNPNKLVRLVSGHQSRHKIFSIGD